MGIITGMIPSLIFWELWKSRLAQAEPIVVDQIIQKARNWLLCKMPYINCKKVLKRDIPWETYMTTKLITGTCFQLLRRYDKRSESYRATLLDNDGPAYIRVFINILRDIIKEETVQYVLALIDEMLTGKGSFLTISSEHSPHTSIAEISKWSASFVHTDCSGMVTGEQEKSCKILSQVKVAWEKYLGIVRILASLLTVDLQDMFPVIYEVVKLIKEPYERHPFKMINTQLKNLEPFTNKGECGLLKLLELQGPFIRMKLTSFKLISLNITPWKHLRVIKKSPQNNREAFNEVDEIPKSDPSCNSSAPR
ncbi:hypothetical protein GIB67_015742 [Kingdonia uniflora]|uniref:Uncharacterized protein n=1 Tax=Kingdonia uniflora TaxID=39325 RepID=A0A7J7NUQ4_9MAGN|nr:hypothetical protein GIB67_015742 [Kingdonia uniflora]